jgi:NAD(P)-dependent dehydrogenase (short-subunit alcohol dehydrogenase family)
MRLDGLRAAVSGAGRGVGLAAATALAEAGAEVVLLARTETEIANAAERIRAAGGNAQSVCLDVSDIASVRDYFATTAAFNILVNCAGTNRPSPLWEVSEDDYDAVLDLNLKSLFFVTQACTRRMIEAGASGSIIHIGSQMGHVGSAGRSIYCASKWAVEGLNKVLALELAPHGIRSNVLAPTFIETALTRPFLEDSSFSANVLAKIKVGRLGRLADLMAPVVLLASDASSLMTGSTLLLDGGWTAD